MNQRFVSYFLPVPIMAALAGGPIARAEVVEYARSGGATQAEISRLDHYNWSGGQSMAAVESASGLGTPNRYWQPVDRPGFVQAEYDRTDLTPVDDTGVVATHGYVRVDYTYQGGRWVATTPPAVWTYGAAAE